MLNLENLLAPASNTAMYNFYLIVSIIMIVLVFVIAVFEIILVLMQPGNSTGINALGGSSETFFGKNKGKSVEERLKRVTYICIAILGVLSIIFFVLQISAIWE